MTLNGGRAVRNEFILLHEFHRLKYICPDKTFGKKSAPVKEDPAEDEDDPSSSTKKTTGGKAKRDKYKGGLVFEPKRGLWDKFILVMDFNSLYPSIIQEYNIDFTTVEGGEGDEVGFSFGFFLSFFYRRSRFSVISTFFCFPSLPLALLR